MSSLNKDDFEKVLGQLNEIEIKHSPSTIYYKGNLDLLKAPRRISIVGSRNASERGVEVAERLATEFAKNGIIVVSGLAKGIDAAAHRGAIKGGGYTIAVIGTPINEYYPKENKALQDEIAANHLLISQFPIGSPYRPANFPIRNRTMALISDGTIIVEAGEKSGTLHQGWEALRLGRPLWIAESVVNDSNLSWPAEMVSYGAMVLSQDTWKELPEWLPVSSRHERSAIAF